MEPEKNTFCRPEHRTTCVRDACIVVLDEPAVGLDVYSEYLLKEIG